MKISINRAIELLKAEHDAWEAMATNPKFHPQYFRDNWKRRYEVPCEDRSRIFKMAAGSLSVSVPYHFGEICPDNAHVRFAADLFKHSAFTLPAPHVVIFRDTTDLSDANSERMPVLHLLEDSAHGLIYSTFVYVRDRKHEELVVPLYSIVGPKIVNMDKTSNVTCEAQGFIPILNQGYIKECFNGDKEALRQFILAEFVDCCGLIAMLGCREVELVPVVASPKLNKARIKNRKLPLKDSYTVKINMNPSLRAIIEGGEVKGHASPRPHWRRGHIRKYHDGQMLKKIPPTYVNWSPEHGTLAPKPKDYFIRK